MDIDKSVIPKNVPSQVREPRDCPDCGAVPGAFHVPGCDVEHCPRCGGQSIGCDCIYEVNGIDVDTMAETHPEIYTGGPTDKMCEVWDKAWDDKRIRWTGYWPGDIECWTLGMVCRDEYADGTPCLKIESFPPPPGFKFHVPCGVNDEGAHADLNRWVCLDQPGVKVVKHE